MLTVEINNFMGISNAVIEASPICLLVGENHQGKSSTLRAISAALTGNTVPLGLKKSEAGMLVKLGNEKALINIKNETSEVSVSWPKASLDSVGTNPPFSSNYATAEASLVDFDDKKKIETIRNLFNSKAGKEDLEKELKGFENEIIEEVWNIISRDGFDSAYVRYMNKGRDLKSHWSVIASEPYGNKKSETWTAKGWDDSLLSSSKDSLEALVSEAKANLEYNIAKQAISDDERTRLYSLALPRFKFEADKQELEASVNPIKEKISVIEKEIQSIEIPENYVVCPHCGGKVVVHYDGLLKANDMSEEEIKKAHTLISEKRKEITALNDELKQTVSKLSFITNNLKQAIDAEVRLEEKKDNSVDLKAVDKKREEVRNAELKLSAFLKTMEAREINKRIVENQKIIDALSENGIRKKAMKRGLNGFNEMLSLVSKDCGFKKIEIDEDLIFRLDGRNYILLSQSEQLRVKIAIQIVIAKIDKSNAIIIDGFEILDPKSRGAVLKALSKLEIHSFVGLMLNDLSKLPNLRKMNLGRVYEVKDGLTKEVL